MFAPRASHFNYLPRLFRVLFVIFEPDLITKFQLTALFYEYGVHDKPSSVDDQMAWLRSAGLHPEVRWSARDLVVVAAKHTLSAR